MAPVLLQYYYENATPNDYFFGSLSGPGYMYPKAIPDSLFSPLMHIADTLCKKLDLNVFETMDYSEGSSGTGNNDLPRKLVEKYFTAMPDMLGILNGYAPSYTFGEVKGKPFISYDYYLDESKPEKDAVDDLNELIAINSKKPYFLALHIREWNDIDRVKRILDKVKGEKEVVSLDVFLKLAAGKSNFEEHYLPPSK
ncbi:GxGYxYP putative glycoside hydrolase C-terminal domain-containing protein [bacterium A37T11]|nr:GxGYxYP putative glycoside hydrolase C-terminal domain-containing protein [bacterium A37T11]